MRTPWTPEQKLRMLEKRMDRVLAGRAKSIQCPYCGLPNVQPRSESDIVELCCQEFAVATAAIIHRREMDLQLESAGRVIESTIKERARPLIIQ